MGLSSIIAPILSRYRARAQARESAARAEGIVKDKMERAVEASSKAGRSVVAEAANRIDAAGENRSQAIILRQTLDGLLSQVNHRAGR